jgi:L-ascorbate metabolism protein UlaG (beta-lactamase superfamily)
MQVIFIVVAATGILFAVVYVFMQLPQFGRAAAGSRLEQIKRSPNFKNGQFQNLSETPSFTDGATFWSVLKEFFFVKHPRKKPASILPSRKNNLHELDSGRDVLVWFGHSSYFMQVAGKKILVDPVLSGSASPIRGTTESFKGSDVYRAEDLPEIDYLFISHDHWDHLDYKTVMQLKPKAKKVITGLGVGEHMERWGYDKNIIVERDWNEEVDLADGFKVITAPARHFSGRKFARNGSIWLSFVLVTPAMRIYFGGDSGYDRHFAEIGNKYGPFDLAVLENGQYNRSWKHIHMMPEEVVQAAIDLKAKSLLPVHWGKFALANHEWDDPIKRVVKESEARGISLLHPLIGEITDLRQPAMQQKWWEGIE